MTLDRFKELFDELDINARVSIYNVYQVEHGDPDKELFEFDEEFFSTFFTNPMEAARATFFGNIQNWMDEYIRINGYGNLESLSEHTAESVIDDAIEDIFEYKDSWEDYIEDEEEDEED